MPSASRPAVGGAEYMAAYVAALKAKNPNTVVVGGGDLIGRVAADLGRCSSTSRRSRRSTRSGLISARSATMNSTRARTSCAGCRTVAASCSPSAWPTPTAGKGFGSSAPGTFDGAKFKWLSANVVETATGRTLLPAYGVKSFGGVKVAFIGMTFKGTPGVVTSTGVAGLSFKDEADTVNALVPRLRAQGIESIVVLVHQGGFQNNPGTGLFQASDIKRLRQRPEERRRLGQ